MNEPYIKTFPLPEVLDNFTHEIDRVLVFRSAPGNLVSSAISTLRKWKSDLSVSLYCHQGEEISGCENIIYPYPGYFSLDSVDLETLRRNNFDLVVIPYGTNRRLHPDYYNLDRIASRLGAFAVLAYYWDGTSLVLNSHLLERKAELIINPYLRRKHKALEEISAFTGEEIHEVEDKCNRGNQLGDMQWNEYQPETQEEIESFYKENDFYIYSLMKECDWKGARADLADSVKKELKPGCSVLDYGGGCGTLSIALARKGFCCSHLDLPGRLLDFASYRFLRRKLDVNIIYAEKKYPLQNSYDAIICTHVIEHFADPEEKIIHMSQHLRENGKLMLAIPFEPNPVAGKHPGMHLNRLSQKKYSELIRELGLIQVNKIDELDIFQRIA